MLRNCLSQCVRVGRFEMVVRRELTELTSVGSWIRTSLCSFVTVPSEDVYIVSEARKRAGSSYRGKRTGGCGCSSRRRKQKPNKGGRSRSNSREGAIPDRAEKK